MFAHIHCLWTFFHFAKGLHIYDWMTFWAFLALGAFQTLIAWAGGILAVKGVQDKFSFEVRRWHYRFFAALGVLLLLMTAVIGYLNDQNQHQAEVKTQEAVGREEKLQATLDQQYPLLVRAGVAVEAAEQIVITGGPSDKVLSQIDEIQRAIAQAVAERAPAPAPVAAEVKDSLSQLSNAELRKSILDFRSKTLAAYGGFYDLQDSVGRVRADLDNDRYPGGRQAAAQDYARLNGSLTSMVNSINQVEIPKANSYIAEVNRRVGGQGPFSHEMPAGAITEAGRFLGSVRFFDDLANRLPVTAQADGKGS